MMHLDQMLFKISKWNPVGFSLRSDRKGIMWVDGEKKLTIYHQMSNANYQEGRNMTIILL